MIKYYLLGIDRKDRYAMKNNSLALKKLNVTQKDIIQFTVLQKLQETSIHAAEIHRFVSERFKNDNLSPTRSRAYVYDSIKEMEELGWISYQVEGRKKIYSLRKEGKAKIKNFKDIYVPLLLHIDKAVRQMSFNVSTKEFRDVKWSLTEEEKRYLSKILNVKAFIQWYILLRLLEQTELHGGELYREMNRWYAWINSHGYFYQVIREMDYEGLIVSRWLNEDTRSKRKYQVTDVGRSQYEELTENIKIHLEGLQQFLRTMIQRFDPDS